MNPGTVGVATPPPASNPLWGRDWPRVRDQWILDPSVTFLNHGSFGACPRPVLDRQLALRFELERRPVEFLARQLPQRAASARERLATFLHADPADLVFVPNATTGVATVLASISLRPGDRILLTDHAYPAVRNAVRRACARAGAQTLVVSIPLPLTPTGQIVRRVTDALTQRTRLAVLDHVTSPTAVVMPIERLVATCRRHGVPVLVDAAHAPGMVPVDVNGLGADYWTGNLHKWVCAPKGAAALHVQGDLQRHVAPLVTSHGYGGSFRNQFDWTGTHDPTPYLSVPAALDFFEGLGWERVRAHNTTLVREGRDALAGALGTAPIAPGKAIGSMAVVALPPDVATTPEEAETLQRRVYEAARIEVPVIAWNGRGYVRLSAHVYNCPADYERLAEALPPLLA